VIKAVVTTLTALMLTAFMLRDRTWTDSATTVMVAILWVVAFWMWWRWARVRGGKGDAPGEGPGAPRP
jgi:hypothetical protein